MEKSQSYNKGLFKFFGDEKRKFIRDLINSWHVVLKEYESKHTHVADLPYWNTERTNIGLLALAARKIKALPLEEFSSVKGKKKQQKTGRADLWILDDNKKSYDLEAKRHELSLNSQNIAKSIRPKLSEALDDVREIKERSDISIGIVFVIPYIKKNSEYNFKSYIDNVGILKAYGADFAGLHFAPKHVWELFYEDGYYYPCITLVGKYLKK